MGPGLGLAHRVAVAQGPYLLGDADGGGGARLVDDLVRVRVRG